MWENTDQKISEYGHFSRSDKNPHLTNSTFFLEYKILRQSKFYLTSDAINPKASQFQKKKRKNHY